MTALGGYRVQTKERLPDFRRSITFTLYAILQRLPLPKAIVRRETKRIGSP